MSRLSTAAVLRLADSVATLLGQAYQAARVRLASAASPMLKLLVQRDHAITQVELLRRELAILRAQREQMPAHQRPDYGPEQRMAILQLKHLRGWGIARTAERFVLHPNTVRLWIKAAQGTRKSNLFTENIVWNKLDDAVRWASHELRWLCPEPEFGTRTIATHLVRAGMAVSRATVQRILREPKSVRPPRPKRQPITAAADVEPHHLLRPKEPNEVWHMDMTTIRILWVRFTLATILDGFSRKLLAIKVYACVPRSRDLLRLIGRTIRACGKP